MKAVLVLDEMPNNCEECQLCKQYKRVPHVLDYEDTYEIFCTGIDNLCLKEVPKGDRPYWCPLKALPNERDRAINIDYMEDAFFNDGWNACLDEITSI